MCYLWLQQKAFDKWEGASAVRPYGRQQAKFQSGKHTPAMLELYG